MSETHLWEVTLAVTNQQARLAASAVTYYDDLLGIGRALSCRRVGGIATRRGSSAGRADGTVARPQAAAIPPRLGPHAR